MPLTSAKGKSQNQTSVYQLETIGLVQLGINKPPIPNQYFDKCYSELAKLLSNHKTLTLYTCFNFAENIRGGLRPSELSQTNF